MYRSIIVTTDFSPESTKAFEPAATLARKFNAKLSVLHGVLNPAIVTPWQSEPTQEVLEERRTEAQKRLEAFVESSPAFASLRVEARALHAPSAEAVCDFVERERDGLLVMATHGHSGLRHFLLGSFTARVLHQARSPVLVFRTVKEPVAAPAAEFHPTRILVPYDFSRPSHQALETARHWASTFDATVKVLHVVGKYAYTEAEPASLSMTVDDYYHSLAAKASAQLTELCRSELKDVPTETAVRIGHPAEEILAEASAFAARLIVMSSRGLSVLDRIGLGSIAERTIQEASCPVLVIRGSKD